MSDQIGGYQTKHVATMQCHPRLACALTQEELDCLISLVQMAEDGSDVTFGDWLSSNPATPEFMQRLQDKLLDIDPTQRVPMEDPDGECSAEDDQRVR